MDRSVEKPKVEEVSYSKGMTFDSYTHPAFGYIQSSVVHGGSDALFGSDVSHSHSRVRIQIGPAKMNRDLSRDWLHSIGGLPFIELEMSHVQYAEFITGKAGATPCTLIYVHGDKEMRPFIDPLESKEDMFKREITDSAEKKLEAFDGIINRLDDLLEGGGSVSKPMLRSIIKDLKNTRGNFSGSVTFVIKQAKEALEGSVSSAKAEIEAYISDAMSRHGMAFIMQQEKKLLENKEGKNEDE